MSVWTHDCLWSKNGNDLCQSVQTSCHQIIMVVSYSNQNLSINHSVLSDIGLCLRTSTEVSSRTHVNSINCSTSSTWHQWNRFNCSAECEQVSQTDNAAGCEVAKCFYSHGARSRTAELTCQTDPRRHQKISVSPPEHDSHERGIFWRVREWHTFEIVLLVSPVIIGPTEMIFFLKGKSNLINCCLCKFRGLRANSCNMSRMFLDDFGDEVTGTFRRMKKVRNKVSVSCRIQQNEPRQKKSRQPPRHKLSRQTMKLFNNISANPNGGLIGWLDDIKTQNNTVSSLEQRQTYPKKFCFSASDFRVIFFKNVRMFTKSFLQEDKNSCTLFSELIPKNAPFISSHQHHMTSMYR